MRWFTWAILVGKDLWLFLYLCCKTLIKLDSDIYQPITHCQTEDLASLIEVILHRLRKDNKHDGSVFFFCLFFCYLLWLNLPSAKKKSFISFNITYTGRTTSILPISCQAAVSLFTPQRIPLNLLRIWTQWNIIFDITEYFIFDAAHLKQLNPWVWCMWKIPCKTILRGQHPFWRLSHFLSSESYYYNQFHGETTISMLTVIESF